MKSFQRTSISFALAIVVTQASATPVNGRVADAATGEAIIGASIIYNNKVGAVTDADGRFHLDIKSYPSAINVSYVGYESLQVKLSERDSVVNIRLHEDAQTLSEVVVVGYGTQKRTQLTGSVTTVKADVFSQSQSATLDGALSGQVAGLSVTASSGQPGADSQLRIRGGNSVNASNEPLYVIDGFIYFKDAANSNTGLGGFASGLNPLATINPNDIESVEVLKDVSATAIYGSRGANGVIIVTTKQGKKDDRRAHISYSYNIGVSSISRKLDLMTATEWAQFQKDYFSNKAGYSDAQIAALGRGTDWQDAVLRTAIQQSHELSITGASPSSGGREGGCRYAFSANHTDQDGIVLNTGFRPIAGTEFQRFRIPFLRRIVIGFRTELKGNNPIPVRIGIRCEIIPFGRIIIRFQRNGGTHDHGIVRHDPVRDSPQIIRRLKILPDGPDIAPDSRLHLIQDIRDPEFRSLKFAQGPVGRLLLDSFTGEVILDQRRSLQGRDRYQQDHQSVPGEQPAFSPADQFVRFHIRSGVRAARNSSIGRFVSRSTIRVFSPAKGRISSSMEESGRSTPK